MARATAQTAREEKIKRPDGLELFVRSWRPDGARARRGRDRAGLQFPQRLLLLGGRAIHREWSGGVRRGSPRARAF